MSSRRPARVTQPSQSHQATSSRVQTSSLRADNLPTKSLPTRDVEPDDAVEDSPRELLPGVQRSCVWHKDNGLVVCTGVRTLPVNITDSSSTKYTLARILKDDLVYYAFYMKVPEFTGRLLQPLRVPLDRIRSKFITKTGNAKFCLDPALRKKWWVLESDLVTVANTLRRKHKDLTMPFVKFPELPHEHNYHRNFDSADEVLKSVESALASFHLLTAFVAFFFTVWLRHYRDEAFDDALRVLHEAGYSYSWLNQLLETSCCDFTPNRRVGGYINPYTTHWGPYINRFSYAGVPVWITWNKQYLSVWPSDPGMTNKYLPPNELILMAQRREAVFDMPLPVPYAPPPTNISSAWDDPPSDHVEADFSLTANLTSGPPPPPPFAIAADDGEASEAPAVASSNPSCHVEKNSRQKPGENYDAFFARMLESYNAAVSKENEKEKQRRESLEAAARKGSFGKKSTMFIWEQDEAVPTFWRRTRVLKDDFDSEWRCYTPNQRRFWGHKNEWDLCEALPKSPPAGPRQETESEIEDREDREEMQEIVPRVDTVEELQAPEADEFQYPFSSFIRFLKRRYGFSADSDETWNEHFHVATTPLSKDQFTRVYQALNYPLPQNDVQLAKLSVVDFYNTISRSDLNSDSLSLQWDLRRTSPLTKTVQQLPIQVICVPYVLKGATDLTFHTETNVNPTCLYVLMPRFTSRDTSPWYIATTHATTVLLVYREGWTTMSEICRGLLELGTPFRTVVRRPTSSRKKMADWRYRSSGVGRRLAGFKPTQDDYRDYVDRRNLLLQSPRGRAVRLRGGIIGRIAMEVVPDIDVLDGPNFEDEIVGSDDHYDYVDDALDRDALDIVSGVYHVAMDPKSKDHIALPSYWPKNHSWYKTGLASNEWAPKSEEWYLARLAKFEGGTLEIEIGRYWNKMLKYHRSYTTKIIRGSERLAAEYIAKS